ncbi:MAG: hypothetical protein ABIS06_00325 [Vicinamibacterales bacterium]
MQQRKGVGRTVVLLVRALPDFERLAALQLVAGDTVVVLVCDEQTFALADPLPVLVGEPRVLFAAAGALSPARA